MKEKDIILEVENIINTLEVLKDESLALYELKKLLRELEEG